MSKRHIRMPSLGSSLTVLCGLAVAAMATIGWLMREAMVLPLPSWATDEALCRSRRYEAINSMTSKTNDFIPYRCYNHNDEYITVFGMHLKDFDRKTLRFWLNGKEVTDVEIHSGHRTFVFNLAVRKEMLKSSGNQSFEYRIGKCSFTMECSNYHDTRKDELNVCVYTKRGLQQIQPFLDFYRNLADRIFVYTNAQRHAASFKRLRTEPEKFKVIPWYLDDLRDSNVLSFVYDELVAYNWRNYSRDAQKVQTNDCMYRNRDTDMLLMVDDDEYLNFHNRKFYRKLYQDLHEQYDDIVLYRNYCNTSIAKETRIGTVLGVSKARCKEAGRNRLEKAFVFPSKCRLYEIHRCTSENSYSLRHLNIYLAHKPYSN